MSKQDYSQKLRKAMSEIEEIFKEYDIAGFVVCHTPGYGEFKLLIDPSYSGAKIQGNELRVKIKKEDFGGDKHKRDQCARNTSNMFMILSEITGPIALKLLEISRKVDEQTNSTHGDFEM